MKTYRGFSWIIVAVVMSVSGHLLAIKRILKLNIHNKIIPT